MKPGASSADSVLGIVWVHPEQRFTPLTGGRCNFGRGESCHVRLHGSQVSRHHASAHLRHGHWVLIDENSKNGVFHNAQRVAEAHLVRQSVVRVGEWVGVVTSVERTEVAGSDPVRPLTPELLGGPALRAAFKSIEAAASSNLRIVLLGETGTGKEMFARGLHSLSKRSGPLLAVNCGALPTQLAESELFGYRKGAFSGADRHHDGFFRAADGGTLFLDEVTDLDPLVQTKLLRVLQEGSVTPLGETHPVAVDVRVVVASHSSLIDAVELGKFRADLLGRLSGIEVRIPPLRERREEVLELFKRALYSEAENHPEITPELAESLCTYDWPLNVREVFQMAGSLAVLHRAEHRLTPAHLPERIASFRSGAVSATAGSVSSGEIDVRSPVQGKAARKSPEQDRAARRRASLLDRDAQELELLIPLIREARGNVSQAALKMGISRQRAYRLLDRHSALDLEQMRRPSGDSS